MNYNIVSGIDMLDEARDPFKLHLAIHHVLETKNCFRERYSYEWLYLLEHDDG